MVSFNVIILGCLLYLVLDMSFFTYQHTQIEHFDVGQYMRLYRQLKKLCVCVCVCVCVYGRIFFILRTSLHPPIYPNTLELHDITFNDE